MVMSEENKKKFLDAYDAYSDALYRHAYFKVFDKGKAEEFTQEAFMKTWEYCASRNIVLKNLRAFLYRVLDNLIIDEFRKKKSVSLDLLIEEGYEPAVEGDNTVDTIAIDKMRSVLLSIDSKYRNLLIMRFVDDLSIPEIAEILEERENTIAVRVHRAIKKLHEAYKASIKEKK